MGEMEGVYFSTSAWVEENSRFFIPPVCNKLMHNHQLKVRQMLHNNQLKVRQLLHNNQLKVRRCCTTTS